VNLITTRPHPQSPFLCCQLCKLFLLNLGDLAGRVYRVDSIGKEIADVVYTDKQEKKTDYEYCADGPS
jgi:hypothetical protein